MASGWLKIRQTQLKAIKGIQLQVYLARFKLKTGHSITKLTETSSKAVAAPAAVVASLRPLRQN